MLRHAQHPTRTNTSKGKQEIDQLVYKLYGLTEEEIEIVEGVYDESGK